MSGLWACMGVYVVEYVEGEAAIRIGTVITQPLEFHNKSDVRIIEI
jgi:hypothetical protein